VIAVEQEVLLLAAQRGGTDFTSTSPSSLRNAVAWRESASIERSSGVL
jgi:hypothetical protein